MHWEAASACFQFVCTHVNHAALGCGVSMLEWSLRAGDTGRCFVRLMQARAPDACMADICQSVIQEACTHRHRQWATRCWRGPCMRWQINDLAEWAADQDGGQRIRGAPSACTGYSSSAPPSSAVQGSSGSVKYMMYDTRRVLITSSWHSRWQPCA